MRLAAAIVGICGLALFAVAPFEDRYADASANGVVRCSPGGVLVLVSGRRVCLREGRQCNDRLSNLYRRHAFVCVSGSLQTPWRFLQRPLFKPLLPDAACPTGALRGDATSIGFTFAGSLWGPGPAYPMLGGDPTPTKDAVPKPVLIFKWPPPPDFGTEWGGSKVLWIVDRSRHRGRVLVRGRELNGPHGLRFNDGRPAFRPADLLSPSQQLRIEEESRDHPAMTRLREAGCYAYQIDGRSFSYLVGFEARVGAAASAPKG